MKCLFVIIPMLSMASCVAPTSMVRTIDDRPSLGILAAPAGSSLYVDGINVGVASEYAGED
jgi:hypothetical protein